MKKSNKKTLVLSVVAFVLILMSLVSFTYSWIDDIKLVEFQNADVADGAPLKAGTDINATVKITKTENEINLGNMIKPSDITIQNYEYDEGYTAPHATYPRNEEEATKQQEFIDKNKGYFYESGDMHLSPCYSNGETFYFQRQNQTGYREGNKDDENVNYISFTVKVSSPDATTDFWFDSVPTIQGKNASGGNVNVSAKARYAIIVDGECHVYSNGGTALTCNSGMTGTEAVSGVRTTAAYTYGNSANTTAERGANSNTLFTVQKGSTVNMTVKIWLEGGFDTNCTASNINLKLISSWAKTRKIWIDDKTTGGAGESWLNNDSAKLYVTFPVFLAEKASSPSDWPNVTNGPFYPITVDSTSHKGYIEVPLVYNNEKMILYRCNNSQIGWNNSTNATQRSEYNVYCWNWWETTTPNTYEDSTYTLYGGSKDSTAKGYFGYSNDWVTDKGYGTWGAVEEINVYSHYSGTDYATKGDNRALYIVDYSDEDASGETYIYEMSRADNGDSTPWKTYVPATSSKIQFRYFSSSNKTWGYKSWYENANSFNPQRRPLASTGLYANNSTVYHFAREFGGDKGWGYWNGADKVYLIKKGFLGYKDVLNAHMFDKQDVFLKTNSTWRSDNAVMSVYCWNGSSNTGWLSMSKISDDTYYAPISGSWTNVLFARRNPNDWNTIWNKTSDLTYNEGQVYDVDNNSWSEYKKSNFPGAQLSAMTYQSGSSIGQYVYKHYSGYNSQVFESGTACVYNRVKFSGSYDTNGTNRVQSNNLNLFPGCFYEPGESNTDAGKWYGALNDTGREASSGGESGGGGGGDSGTDIGGGSMDGFTYSSGGFVFNVGGTNYTAYANQAGTQFKVKVTSLSPGTHLTTVNKSGTYYKNGASYTVYDTKANVDLYLSTVHSNDFAIRNYSSGNFIITFQYDNGNTGTIKITSILKEG